MPAYVEVSGGKIQADISMDNNLYQINRDIKQLLWVMENLLDEFKKYNAKFDECAMVVRKNAA